MRTLSNLAWLAAATGLIASLWTPWLLLAAAVAAVALAIDAWFVPPESGDDPSEWVT